MVLGEKKIVPAAQQTMPSGVISNRPTGRSPPDTTVLTTVPAFSATAFWASSESVMKPLTVRLVLVPISVVMPRSTVR